jgi:hypothetical protein
VNHLLFVVTYNRGFFALQSSLNSPSKVLSMFVGTPLVEFMTNMRSEGNLVTLVFDDTWPPYFGRDKKIGY